MGHFEVALFSTRGLHERCEREFGDGWKARDVAAAFVEGAFDRSETHTVDVVRVETPVDAPRERVPGSFEAPFPGDGADEGEGRAGTDGRWPNLRRWWNVCLNESDEVDATPAKDCNLLLTAADGSGLGGPREACAGGSFVVAASYDEYQPWDQDPAFNKVDTLLEELGHTLVHDMEDLDYGDHGDGVVAHDSGTLYEHDGVYAITPIGISGDTRYNNCGERVDKERWNGDAWEARYSECTERYFRER